MDAFVSLFRDLRKSILDLIKELQKLNETTSELRRLNKNLEELNKQFKKLEKITGEEGKT